MVSDLLVVTDRETAVRGLLGSLSERGQANLTLRLSRGQENPGRNTAGGLRSGSIYRAWMGQCKEGLWEKTCPQVPPTVTLSHSPQAVLYPPRPLASAGAQVSRASHTIGHSPSGSGQNFTLADPQQVHFSPSCGRKERDTVLRNEP